MCFCNVENWGLMCFCKEKIRFYFIDCENLSILLYRITN